jgi:hypothetical protein
MVKINPKNVAKLLFDDISAKYTKVTPINAKEIELKDQILGIHGIEMSESRSRRVSHLHSL